MPLIEPARAPIWSADQRRPASESPVVVLIHGAAGSRLDWSAEMRRLRAGVIALDLPGHGKSPAPGRSSVAEYAADVVALLDALKVDRAALVGHSLGAAIALQIALDHAERALGIALIGAGAKLAVHPDILNNIQTDQAKVAALLSEWFWAQGAPEDQRQQGYAALMQTPADVMLGDFTASNAFDVRDRLAEIRVPTLIVSGAEDRMTPPKNSQYLHDRIAGSRLVTIERAGHKVVLEKPQAAADAVQAWLDKLR